MKNPLYIYSVLTLTFLSLAGPAEAVLMKGEGHRLRTELFDTFTKEKIVVKDSQAQESQKGQVSSQDPSSPTSPQTRPGKIALSINPDTIDFGTLTAGEPIQRSIQITLESEEGFTLQIAEDGPLTSGDNSIPDTTCDNGSCTPGLAAPWQNPLVYGFGYTCQGSTPCIGFSSAQYKPLPNLSENMTPQSIIEGKGNNKIQTELTFKVNIPPTNAGLKYNNNIILYSLPNY